MYRGFLTNVDSVVAEFVSFAAFLGDGGEYASPRRRLEAWGLSLKGYATGASCQSSMLRFRWVIANWLDEQL